MAHNRNNASRPRQLRHALFFFYGPLRRGGGPFAYEFLQICLLYLRAETFRKCISVGNARFRDVETRRRSVAIPLSLAIRDAHGAGANEPAGRGARRRTVLFRNFWNERRLVTSFRRWEFLLLHFATSPLAYCAHISFVSLFYFFVIMLRGNFAKKNGIL